MIDIKVYNNGVVIDGHSEPKVISQITLSIHNLCNYMIALGYKEYWYTAQDMSPTLRHFGYTKLITSYYKETTAMLEMYFVSMADWISIMYPEEVTIVQINEFLEKDNMEETEWTKKKELN